MHSLGGKTSLLGRMCCLMRGFIASGEEMMGDGDNKKQKRGLIEPVIVVRFIGTSPDSSTISALIVSLCEQVIQPTLFTFM